MKLSLERKNVRKKMLFQCLRLQRVSKNGRKPPPRRKAVRESSAEMESTPQERRAPRFCNTAENKTGTGGRRRGGKKREALKRGGFRMLVSIGPIVGTTGTDFCK